MDENAIKSTHKEFTQKVLEEQIKSLYSASYIFKI
jgi:hypothetical protein